MYWERFTLSAKRLHAARYRHGYMSSLLQSDSSEWFSQTLTMSGHGTVPL